MPLPNDFDHRPPGLGLPPSAFSGQSNDSSDDTDGSRSSPTGSSGSGGSNHDMVLQFDNTDPSEATPAQGPMVLEMSAEQCAAYNMTPKGPEHTCGYLDASGVACGKRVPRQDRFKYHVQAHLGVMPYACAEKASPQLKCNRMFSSATERDTHVKNKEQVTLACGTKALPKNCARHRGTCSTCSPL